MENQCKEISCELATMLENMPQNRPLYKDSGLWQVRTDDMEDVIFEQGVNESFFDFIKRFYDKETKLEMSLKCENEAISFTKDKLRVVAGLLSEDYKTGYKEGVEHYIASKNDL